MASTGSGAIAVGGVQEYVDSGPCYDPSDAFSTTMTGDLIGCWHIDTFNVTGADPSGGLRASGAEHFTGCIDVDGDGSCTADPSGTFNTTYTFTGKFDLTGAELHGRCHHVIASGSGGFDGISGVVAFHDDDNTGFASYSGTISLSTRP